MAESDAANMEGSLAIESHSTLCVGRRAYVQSCIMGEWLHDYCVPLSQGWQRGTHSFTQACLCKHCGAINMPNSKLRCLHFYKRLRERGFKDDNLCWRCWKPIQQMVIKFMFYEQRTSLESGNWHFYDRYSLFSEGHIFFLKQDMMMSTIGDLKTSIETSLQAITLRSQVPTAPSITEALANGVQDNHYATWQWGGRFHPVPQDFKFPV